MSIPGAQATLLLMALCSSNALALEEAKDLRDLNARNLDEGQRQMKARGYEMLQPAGEHGSPEHWWNPRSKRCVFLKTDGKKISAMRSVDGRDCDFYIKKKARLDAAAANLGQTAD